MDMVREDLGLDASMGMEDAIDTAVAQLGLEVEAIGLSVAMKADRVLIELRGESKESVAKTHRK